MPLAQPSVNKAAMAYNILIAGGGIGGLTTALACIKAGHNVTVFEQAETISEIGAGIQLSPNAMSVLRKLGLETQLMECGFSPSAIETRMGQSGSSVFRIPIANHWDAPYIHIHRAKLIAVLKQALQAITPDCFKLGSTVENYTQTANNVTINLSNGANHTGDILIGADGIHSTIRAQMLGHDEPQFTGNTAWRAVVPKNQIKGELPPPTACAWMGPGRHAVTYHLGDDLINFVGVVEQEDWQIESWKEKGDKNELLNIYTGWHPIIQNLINAVDPNNLFRWTLFDRLPLCQWTDRRVALLGDSAHPMLPFLAQGAAMAIEDAYTLANEILKPEVKIGDALEAYQSARYHRASRVQSASRANMKVFHRRNALTQLATYGPMWLGGKIAPNIVRKRLDWIYKG